MTSDVFRSVVQASPQNRALVHPCGSQRGPATLSGLGGWHVFGHRCGPYGAPTPLRPPSPLPEPTAGVSWKATWPGADEGPAAMTARFPRTRGARISGFPRSSPAGEGAASGSACGCTSPCLPAANICRRSPSSSVCNDGQWSYALYLPARVGRCLAARQQCFPGGGGQGLLATSRAVTTLGSQMKTTAATGMSRRR
jgi:hypothetical protein